MNSAYRGSIKQKDRIKALTNKNVIIGQGVCLIPTIKILNYLYGCSEQWERQAPFCFHNFLVYEPIYKINICGNFCLSRSSCAASIVLSTDRQTVRQTQLDRLKILSRLKIIYPHHFFIKIIRCGNKLDFLTLGKIENVGSTSHFRALRNTHIVCTENWRVEGELPILFVQKTGEWKEDFKERRNVLT